VAWENNMGQIRNVQLAHMLAATPIAAPDVGAEQPVLVVVETAPSLLVAIDEVCNALGVRVEVVGNTLALAETLHALRPIGVLAVVEEIDCAVYDMLMAVAGFEPDLPVLLATDTRASVRGAVNSAHRLWQLTGLIHLTRRLDASDVVEFLYRAGRRSGTGRLIPV
jgi:hypothetical protein